MTYNLVAFYFIIVHLIYQTNDFYFRLLSNNYFIFNETDFFLVFASCVQLENGTAEMYWSDILWELKTSLFWLNTIFIVYWNIVSVHFQFVLFTLSPVCEGKCQHRKSLYIDLFSLKENVFLEQQFFFLSFWSSHFHLGCKTLRLWLIRYHKYLLFLHLLLSFLLMFLICIGGDHAKLSFRDWVREAKTAIWTHDLHSLRSNVGCSNTVYEAFLTASLDYLLE